MSTLKTNTIKNTDDVEMYLAKAWVNFNGTGTVAIRAAGNVSSITDNGTGNYTVNLTNAMPDTNYAYTANHALYPGVIGWTFPFAVSTSSFSVITFGNASYTSYVDAGVVTAAIFR